MLWNIENILRIEFGSEARQKCFYCWRELKKVHSSSSSLSVESNKKQKLDLSSVREFAKGKRFLSFLWKIFKFLQVSLRICVKFQHKYYIKKRRKLNSRVKLAWKNKKNDLQKKLNKNFFHLHVERFSKENYIGKNIGKVSFSLRHSTKEVKKLRAVLNR